jgi:hypothetical protein
MRLHGTFQGGTVVPEVPVSVPDGTPVVLEFSEPKQPRSAIDVIESLAGHRSFASADEVDRFLQAERDAWDR